VSVERDACAAATSSCSSSRSVDVGFCILRRFYLDNEVNARDIKSTSSDICGDKNLEFILFKSLEGNFTLVLCNIAMHDLNLVFNFVGQK
jgi:hypothetical protein